MNRFAVARIVPLLFLLCVPSCQKAPRERMEAEAQAKAAAESAAATGSKPVAGRQEGDLTADEVKNYLNGKSLEIPGEGEGTQPGSAQAARTVVIKKASIRALRIGDGSSINRGPWNHDVTFLFDTGSDTFAVEGSVEHRVVEEQQAFFGFTVKRVVKQ